MKDIARQSLNFPQAFKITTSINSSDMLHTHSKHELVLCAKGKGLQYFKDQALKMDSGSFFWIPKSVPHIGSALNSNFPTLYVIDVDEKWYTNDTYEDGQTIRAIKTITSFVKSNSYHIKLTQLGTKKVTSIIEEIIEEHNEKQPCWQMTVKSLTTKLISIIIRYSAISILSDQTESPSKERMLDVCHYIKNNLYQAITIESVAKMTNLSRSHFHVLFRETTNQTFIQFLNFHRIKKAEELLQRTDKQVEDIIRECGFRSKSQFYISLKKYSGKTPKQLREGK
ncbi:MAG: AraC family transcriptional regulator [Kiritimatiellae bacterium]|jgi:AraC-like DNA-binding protein|nr:AraC family transcriptional regulator [Kiritimatiellia bacterium]